MTKPFFSVIIPTLNEEHYIGVLLQNLLDQEDISFEVVIVDGMSTDKTFEVVSSFKQRFTDRGIDWSIWQIPKKDSVSVARNYGAGKSRGMYFVFFDADVAIGVDFLQKLHDHLVRTKARFATTRVMPDRTTILLKVLTECTNYLIFLARFINKPFILGFNIIIEKTAFSQIGGFDETALLAEDHALAESSKKHGIRLSYFSRPILTCNMRRFRHEGTFSLIRKYIQSTFHVLFKGRIRKQIYTYKLGGGQYSKRKTA